MAYEGRSPNVSSPEQHFEAREPKESRLDEWYPEGNEVVDTYGPSSVEVQPDLSSSPRSISHSSQLDDFNESLSPPNPLEENRGEDLDIMGIANTWNDDDAFGGDSAAPARGTELSCLGMGQSASSGPWPSPAPLFPGTLELLEEDRESVCELLGDVSDSNSCPGVCGLRNLGNTCFMNAGLQCLINTSSLLNFFLCHSVEEQFAGEHSVHLTAQFSAFLLKMWSGHFSTLRPTEFKHTLSLYHPQFKDYRQHDCQEFLALLLDTLHEQLCEFVQKVETCERLTEPSSRRNGGDECCVLGGEPMELYESSRSSQLSSPRSSDSVETNSSCATSCSSSRNKANALSLRSLPIPEEVKEPMFPVSATAVCQSSSQSELLFVPSSTSAHNSSLVMERNLLNPSPVLEKNLLCELSSMMKDSKTANVNISTSTSSELSANNEIFFDSGKFPPSDLIHPRATACVASNLLRNNDIELFSQQQLPYKNKIKMTNVLKEAAKRLSQDQTLNISAPVVVDCIPSPSNESSSSSSSSSKKARIGDPDPQPVFKVDDRDVESPWDSLHALGKAVKAEEEEEPRKEEDSCMESSSRSKDSVVTEAFQGRFRSTVVCCSCKHVSITYEPFMYLSLPLPRALERVVHVMFIPASAGSRPRRHRLVLQLYDEVSKMRQLLVKMLQLEDGEISQLVLAEVANHNIARILEDQLLVRYLKDEHRTVYAFIVPPPPPSLTPSYHPETSSSSTAEDVIERPSVVERAWKSCAICLEEMADKDLRKHTSCSCLLCQMCIEASCRHYAGGNGYNLVCPVCAVEVKPEEEFAPLDKLHEFQPVIRLLNIPVLFRTLSPSDNGKSCRLLNHPRIFQLPNIISPKGLYDAVQQLFPQLAGFDICFVEAEGVRCARCVYPIRCTGCKIGRDVEQVSLLPGDSLAVQNCQLEDESVFESSITGAGASWLESDSSCSDKKESLSLADCLSAFSESETLDEGNPWFCPNCQKRQCASKTLNIYQAPPYLIVYLKRFVYHNNNSSKLDNRVEFPLNGLSLQPYIDGSDIYNNSDNNDYCYDLYGVVCHFGGVSSGHYTAYTKHVNTGEWHYYNDETVLTRTPQEEDFSNGYVLFYQRRTITCPAKVPEK